MNIYDVTGCKCVIAQPEMKVSKYYNNCKPFAVCNASLYDFNTRVPIGTIIEYGKLKHNDGNGYGFGTVDGVLTFGKPWERDWSDYITGYNAPVQNGGYVAPPFADSYVFPCKLNRIGIGKKNGHTYIVTDDNVTLKQFANNAISLGFDTLVNLDGGGSRDLYYNGKHIYSSARTPYNVVAFFNDGGQKTAPCPYNRPTDNVRLGNVGSAVKWVQWQLNRHGASLSVDGIFGLGTRSAVIAFQKSNGLSADGICGVNTNNALEV